MIDTYVLTYGEHGSISTLVRAMGLVGDQDILDVGCGTGVALRAVPNGAGRRVGVEPFTRMLDHARDSAAKAGKPGLEFVQTSAEDLPFEAASFDRVFALNVVHHWQDAEKGLAEAFRVLRPGGVLAIGGDVFDEERLPGGQDYSGALRAAGFGALTMQKPDAGLFLMLAEKPEGKSE